ncbi:CAZyme family AA7 [Paecilomyces variotii]|nr:CAZyme family AA7 [Paecilomyces variotii]
MAPFFANQSCDPFLPKEARCIIGTYIQYAVNASSAVDVQKTIAFVKGHNIRLVIRNTGHDYLGKSTGAGAVGIWTHHMKDIEFLDYRSPSYTGKAVKVGAGVQIFEVNEAAHAQSLVVVGGNCQTVGIAGGYSQGGGHGQLASQFGLAADQVLEWEVVTADGDLVTASPSENADLYWALAGGGGGTYGVVLSMTSKAYPELQTATANLTFTNTGVSQDTFLEAVQTFVTSLNPILDAGGVSIWLLTNSSFSTTPTTLPGGTKAELQNLLSPSLKALEKSNITYSKS